MWLITILFLFKQFVCLYCCLRHRGQHRLAGGRRPAARLPGGPVYI